MTGGGSPRGRALAAALIVAFVASAVALAGVICIEVPFLSNDGPSHVQGAFIHARLHDASLGFAERFVANSPWTSRGFDNVFRWLLPALGWRLAMQTSIVIVAELWAVSFFVFVVALAPRRAVVGLLGFPLALQTSLYFGFYPFMLGTAFGLLALAAFVRKERPGVVDHVATGVLLLLAAYCHVFAAGLAGLAAGAVVLARGEGRGPLLRAWLALFVASLPALVIMVLASRTAVDVRGGGGEPLFPGLVERTLFVESAFQPRGLLRPFACLALACGGALIAVRGGRRGTGRREERGLVVVGAALVLVSMSLPRDFLSWQLFDVRCLPLGTALLFALVAVERAGVRGKAVAVVVIAGYAVGSFASAARLHAEIRDAARPALAGLGKVKPHPLDYLPVIVSFWGARRESFGIDSFTPLIHVDALYAMELGGATAYAQDRIASMHLALRKAPWQGDVPEKESWLEVARARTPEDRRRLLRVLLSHASTDEGVIFYGEPQDRALLDEAGFVPTFADGGLFIGTFQGCDGVIELSGLDGPADAVAGWWPRRSPLLRVHLLPDQEGVATAVLPRMGCGEVWLDVPHHRCAGVVPNSPVRARFTRDAANAFICDVERQPPPRLIASW